MSDNSINKEPVLEFSDGEDAVVLNRSDAEQSDDERPSVPEAPEHHVDEQDDGPVDSPVGPPEVAHNSNDDAAQGSEAQEDKDLDRPDVTTKAPPKYTIPNWFLAHNVRTGKELDSDLQSPCRIVVAGDNVETDKSKPAEDKIVNLPEYELSQSTISSLRDLTAAALVPDKRGKLSTFCLGPVIRGLTDDEFPLLSGLLHLVAKDLDASLVSFGWEDLEELGREFDGQDQLGAADESGSDDSEPATQAQDQEEEDSHPDPSPLESERDSKQSEQEETKSMNELTARYFSCWPVKNAKCDDWKRVQAAIDAVIDSHLVKSTQQDPVLMIHIQAANRIAFKNGSAEEYRTLCRFADNVIARRSSNQRVVLIGSMIRHPTEYQYGYDAEEKLADFMDVGKCGSMLDFRAESLLSLYLPRIEGESTCSDETLNKSAAFTKRRMNLGLLKRALRGNIAHLFRDEVRTMLEPSVGDPTKGWFDPEKSLDDEEWGRKYWTQEDIDNAVVRIQGRALGKSCLELEDVRAVLRQVDLIGDPTYSSVAVSSPGSDESATEDVVEDEKPESWAEKIERIKGEATDVELDLIDNVVNPDSIDVTFDEVVMDPSTKEHLQTLISLSSSSSSPAFFLPIATSRFLKSQLRLSSTLLYGPSGTGKTHLARAIASCFPGSSFLALDAAALVSKWTGETEKAIQAAFSVARKLSPCVLFMDEVDALFYKRTNDDSSWQRSALAQFLMEMDGINKDAATDEPFVVVATNRPQDLDEAFYRRLPSKIYFGLPGQEARGQILEGLVGGDLDDDGEGEGKVTIDGLASMTEGYSGSDLKNLCAEAALIWAVDMVKAREKELKLRDEKTAESEVVEKDEQGSEADGEESKEEEKEKLEETKNLDEVKVKVGATHFAKALTKVRPSVSRVGQQGLEQFRRRFNPGSRV
ncbi:P-loop containing nucleoside triphosphate hydrolase protein [Rhypophila decipiens]|uniref:P-loop containing nucleoside triphosphate hydrolase protein n=1 Tax=Rhypophila decipiens TaxID=261697 RepID=A0AAN7B8R4_9PEZI|nr:P-loop containing nucleoside triphosphate hydrolase protein [Rhypophila decipiens]